MLTIIKRKQVLLPGEQPYPRPPIHTSKNPVLLPITKK
jgi:hypothetical protein